MQVPPGFPERDLRFLPVSTATSCQASPMIFGEGLEAPAEAPSVRWIDQACLTRPWTVGALVPNGFGAHLRIWPPPDTHEFWADYAELHRVVGLVGERHTSTPSEVTYAIWDGHGFDTRMTAMAWAHPPVDESERQARAAELARLSEEDRRRNAAVRTALASLPAIERPGRRYLVVSGPVDAVIDLREPGEAAWRNPDLWWPLDRAWFVATDVDFWSLYVGGSTAFVTDLMAAVPARTRVERVDLDVDLETEI